MRSITMYKKTASMQIGFIPGSVAVDATGKKNYNDAVVMISFCKSKGERSYDCENTKTIALPYWDVMKLHRAILKGFTDKNSSGASDIIFVHKYKDKTTTFVVGPGNEGTFKWSITQKKATAPGAEVPKDSSDTIPIYCDANELHGLRSYLEICYPLMLEDIKE